jgi:hypothetical protein
VSIRKSEIPGWSWQRARRDETSKTRGREDREETEDGGAAGQDQGARGEERGMRNGERGMSRQLAAHNQ